MHIIGESLLIGNIDDAREPAATVSAVLLVAEEYEVSPPSWVTFVKIPMQEFAPADPATLSRAVEWLEMHLPSNRVMVCCRAGIGRSASVVIAYLCCVQGMAYSEAARFVMVRRPGAMPLPKLQEAIQELISRRQNRDRITEGRKKRQQATPRVA